MTATQKVKVTCPACKAEYDTSETNLGREATCKECGVQFTAGRSLKDQKVRICCPNCQVVGWVPASRLGETANCKRCGTSFSITVGKAVPTPSVAVSDRWKVGETIEDLYRIDGVLGEGGFGRVYKVHHLEWDIDLAVKCPTEEALESAGGRENFVRECHTWMDLGLHNHIATCHFVRVLDGIPRVFAEYVEGGTLHDWIADRRLLNLDQILDIAIQFAWGLEIL